MVACTRRRVVGEWGGRRERVVRVGNWVRRMRGEVRRVWA